MAEENFRFLTSEEFNFLKQSEKLDYLARAVAALERSNGGGPQVFADAPEEPSRSSD